MQNNTASSPCLFKIRPLSPRLKVLAECTSFICSKTVDVDLIPPKYKIFVDDVLNLRQKVRLLVKQGDDQLTHPVVEQIWYAIHSKHIIKRTPVEIEFLEIVFELETKEVKHLEAVALLCDLYEEYANFILLHQNENKLYPFILSNPRYLNIFINLEEVFHKYITTHELQNQYFHTMDDGSINKDRLAKFFLTQPLLVQELENEMSNLAFLGYEFNDYQKKLRRSIFLKETLESESEMLMYEKKCRA